jgi:transposase InsO family protein
VRDVAIRDEQVFNASKMVSHSRLLVTQSFFATLERELLNRRRFRSQAEAKMAVFEWIEGWYNPPRRHSSLGYRSPVNYERAHQRSIESDQSFCRLRRQTMPAVENA